MPGARHPRRGEVRTLDHTHGMTVGVKQKVTVSIEEHLLARIDELVQSELMESRSGAIEAGIEQLLAAQVEAEYERNLALLAPEEEQALAEEGMNDWSTLVSRDTW